MSSVGRDAAASPDPTSPTPCRPSAMVMADDRAPRRRNVSRARRGGTAGESRALLVGDVCHVRLTGQNAHAGVGQGGGDLPLREDQSPSSSRPGGTQARNPPVGRSVAFPTAVQSADMITRSVSEVVGSERDVHGPGWKSRRLIVADDDVGYSLHETILEPGVELRFEYLNHRETVYCIDGAGSVEDLNSGRRVPLRPGSTYSAGIGEPHVVRADTEVKVLCVFTPALTGTEEAD